MTLPNIDTVKTAAEAVELAQNWQVYASEASLYMSELAEAQAYFEALARKFALTEEFKENAII